VDAEDGTTSRLALSVHPLFSPPTSSNSSASSSSASASASPQNASSSWLLADQQPPFLRLEGVPLELLGEEPINNGDVFRFRLEARDRAGQVGSSF
jgi:hypothetical protein